MRIVYTLLACVVSGLVALPLTAEPARQTGAELVGKPASAWRVEHWIGSSPLSLEQLRGEVVLVRWWTAPECPFCGATAPALNEFDAQYRARGLRVIGFYHHKSSSPLSLDEVARYTKLFNFKFPVAVDPHWQTLKAWWLAGGKRDFTSVSFLIDRRGVIRHIHPGGQYVKGDAAYAALQKMIEQLLAEPG